MIRYHMYVRKVSSHCFHFPLLPPASSPNIIPQSTFLGTTMPQARRFKFGHAAMARIKSSFTTRLPNKSLLEITLASVSLLTVDQTVRYLLNSRTAMPPSLNKLGRSKTVGSFKMIIMESASISGLDQTMDRQSRVTLATARRISSGYLPFTKRLEWSSRRYQIRIFAVSSVWIVLRFCHFWFYNMVRIQALTYLTCFVYSSQSSYPTMILLRAKYSKSMNAVGDTTNSSVTTRIPGSWAPVIIIYASKFFTRLMVLPSAFIHATRTKPSKSGTFLAMDGFTTNDTTSAVSTFTYPL